MANAKNVEQARYTWLADGTKCTVTDPAGNGFAYLGSLQYVIEGGVPRLESTPFAGGRFVAVNSPSGTEYLAQYFITDHLGSVRAIVDDSGEALTYNNYYPYGSRWSEAGAATSSRFLYNGKELQTTGSLSLLDYGSRMYDPLLGRWFNTDPAAQFANPYIFGANSPMMFVDPDGESVILTAALIGAAIGGTMNLISNARNIANFREGLTYFAIGTAAGAAGGASGGAVFSAIGISGFLGGAISGAVGGGVGSGMTGAGNACMNGASFRDGVVAGAVTGATSIATGAATGGLIGGVAAKVNGYSFWDGYGTFGNYITPDYADVPMSSGGMSDFQYDYLDSKLAERAAPIGLKVGDDGVNLLTSRTPFDVDANGNRLFLSTSHGNYYNVQTGGTARGLAIGYHGLGTRVYIGPNAVMADDVIFRYVAGHEYIHALQNYFGLKGSRLLREASAHEYSNAVLTNGGPQYLKYINYEYSHIFVPPAYRFYNFPKYPAIR